MLWKLDYNYRLSPEVFTSIFTDFSEQWQAMTADYIIHHWYVDFSSGTLLHQLSGEERRLGEYQFKLLLVLAENAGKTLSRDELTTLVWERRVIGINSLPNAIHALRVALEDDGKQQRIIKTIPKKGYILEAEFCQRIYHDTEEAPGLAGASPQTSVQEDGIPLQDEPPVDPAVLPALAETKTTINAELKPRLGRAFWPWLIFFQVLLLLVVLAWAGRALFPVNSSQLVKKNSVPYSHIQLMELRRGWDNSSASYDLNKLLGPVLFTLNQNLKNQKVTMEIFYYTSGTTLNYTMTLSNQCDRKQLAMNIINWRTDGAQLSALIYREGERKINEMANCVN
ncbi:winged helix-turn-helix domain-containing protein [Erwinia rhapontici]|uniref:transcriptional regulator n=1 Tax=Erwinia rhapontici TaxID=55212 RepID=UPI003BA13939